MFPVTSDDGNPIKTDTNVAYGTLITSDSGSPIKTDANMAYGANRGQSVVKQIIQTL